MLRHANTGDARPPTLANLYKLARLSDRSNLPPCPDSLIPKMQYNNMYPHDGRQPYSPPSQHPRPPANHLPSGSMNQSHPPQAPPYPPINTIVQRDFMAGGGVGSASQSLPYPQYPPQGPSIPRDDHRPYLTQSSQSEHYPPPHSQSHSYPSVQSGPMDPHSSRSSSRPPDQFIPTPSQNYGFSHSPPTALPNTSQRRPSIDPYYHMSPNPQHTSHPALSPPHAVRGGGSSSLSGPHSHSQSQPLNPSGDRYPCELCDRSFTRSHDRRRHYETVHATAPVLHRCRYCQKDFSRADSLKRHIDNGCDEMSSHR